MEVGNRTVPDRMMGCWARRYIKFRNGETDTTTRVIWLQTLSAMVDIRIPRRRLDFSGLSTLEDYSFEHLLELAEQDCGTAVTLLDEDTGPHPTASWTSADHDACVQSIVNFPEDGWFAWREDGKCMMEWAPSGAYEEDWRLQSDSRTYIALYRSDHPQRYEAVFVAGSHAVYVLGRRVPLQEEKPLRDILLAHREDLEYIRALLDLEFSYACRGGDEDSYAITLSTLPYREKQELDISFLLRADAGRQLIQQPGSDRTWRRLGYWRAGDA